MTFGSRESSLSKGEPVELYLFKGADPTLESLLRSVTIIPGTTEFGYGTTRVATNGQPANYLAGLQTSDFVAAVDDLLASASGVEHVSLVVAWHGTDLRCGSCEIRPKVEVKGVTSTPYNWQVGALTRETAQQVSLYAGAPASGGAPSDRSVYEAIVYLKSRGLRVTLYPFILMDVPPGNSLPNPYGGTSQPAYPWRGRITCHPAPGESGSPDKTSTAATQVAAFFGTSAWSDFSWNGTTQVVTYSGPDEWSFRRFIYHMAMIASAAGGVDDFLIGSELIGLTTVRSSATAFPAVTHLIDIAAGVSARLPGARISYAADWSEYHSYRPSDGSGDVFFHLDPLWASSNIDYVGIDNYLPIADWRDGDTHLDRQLGYLTGHDRRYIQSNIEGGENYDWFYASNAARTNQVRTPIEDEAEGKDWVFRNKDIRNWWLNQHYNRPGGVESETPTAWAPQSKPIVFTEIGCPAVDKGANQPNVFVDPKSSESDLPHFSNGRRDDAMQRVFLEASLEYWRPSAGNNPTSTVYGGPMIDWSTISVWTWDARPHPAFPERTDYWKDAANWSTGHWINGRVFAGRDFDSGIFGPYAYTDAEQPITFDGVTYEPIPIEREAINSSGTLDKAMLKVRASDLANIGDEFKAYPPAQVVNLIIRQGHVGESTNVQSNYPVIWTGRVLGCGYPPNEIEMTCEPISTAIKRPGLRRNYQTSCPHVLYGSECRANRAAATRQTTVMAATNSRVTVSSGWNGSFEKAKFQGGMIGWTRSNGVKELRTILQVDAATNRLLIAGTLTDLAVGDTVDVILGCAHDMTDCANLHSNIHNYGGQPWIPLQNPIGAINNFY